MTGAAYKGAAPATTDTIGGHAQVMFASLFTALPQVKTGKLRALATAGPKRAAHLPDIPTLKEVGVDGVEGMRGCRPRHFPLRSAAAYALFAHFAMTRRSSKASSGAAR